MNLTIENYHGQLVADSREVAALPYKEIYRACKVRLSAVQNALSPCEGPVAV